MRFHLGVSIKGLEDRLLGKIPKKYGTWDIFYNKDGTKATKSEVYAEIVRNQKLGYEVIVSDDCDHRDEKGHCLGHKTETKT